MVGGGGGGGGGAWARTWAINCNKLKMRKCGSIIVLGFVEHVCSWWVVVVVGCCGNGVDGEERVMAMLLVVCGDGLL